MGIGGERELVSQSSIVSAVWFVKISRINNLPHFSFRLNQKVVIKTIMSSSAVLALGDLLNDFEVKQRGVMLMAVDKAMVKVMKKQSEMLDVIKSHVETRHRVAMDDSRDKAICTQPSLLESIIDKTLSNAGLVCWIINELKQNQALEYINKLRSHLESGQRNAFRNDFEGLLDVYMDVLSITKTRGSRLINRIEDLYEALYLKAEYDADLVNLVYRVRWGCRGVNLISNTRQHHASLLSENEVLELCGCFSAIGEAMSTLALEFNACKSKDSPTSSPVSTDSGNSMNGNIELELAMLPQHRQAANVDTNDLDSPFDFVTQLMANNGINANSIMQSPTYFQGDQSIHQKSSHNFLPGFSNTTFGDLSSSQVLSTSLGNISAQTSSLATETPDLSGLDLTDLIGLNGGSKLSPSLSRLGSIGSTASNSSRETPPLPQGYNDTYGSVWSQPPLPKSTNSPQNSQPPLPPRANNLLHQSSYSLSQPSLPSNAESTHTRSAQTSTTFTMKQLDVPTQAIQALVSKFSFYHDRPTELSKENDRVRKAMFARMLNHINELPKATLCPLLPGHDSTCPLSHTYMEVMSYNPLYKRLVCRQPSHYWGSQLEEDDSCVCLHIDTGLTWDWMDDAKRLYCLRGAKCTNLKCYKSHSFEEMCWYNPSYKIKRCSVRTHDHIARARGTIEPPLDCNYYHIEEGKNCDKRDFTAESDHVGVNVQMLFTERTHKPLADRLEAIRYQRANNL
ncbi:hypothetical protein Plhal304r1_c002g0009041 [Plasmopara halstedii]